MDETTLDELVGRVLWMEVAGAPEVTERVESVVVGHVRGILRLESDHPDAGGLHGCSVVGEYRAGQAMTRLSGSVEVLIPSPRPTVLAFTPHGPGEEVQRRWWVRVPTSIPAELALTEGSEGAATAIRAIDLSGGGTRIMGLSEAHPGDLHNLTLQLPDGSVSLQVEVVVVRPDGTVGLRFIGVLEAQASRLARRVFELQLAERRRGRRAGP